MRFASRLFDWADEARFVPFRHHILRWSFDYILAHGEPVTFGIRSTHPLIEVNPEPKTWASGASFSAPVWDFQRDVT